MFHSWKFLGVSFLVFFSCKPRGYNDSLTQGVGGSAAGRTFENARELASIKLLNGSLACIGEIGSEAFIWKTPPQAKQCAESLPKNESQMLKLSVSLTEAINFGYGGYFSRGYYLTQNGLIVGKDSVVCVGGFDRYCDINFDGLTPVITIKLAQPIQTRLPANTAITFALEPANPPLPNFKTLVITNPKNNTVFRIPVEDALELSKARESEDYMIFPQYPESSKPPLWVQKGYPVLELRSKQRLPLDVIDNSAGQLSLRVGSEAIPLNFIQSISFEALSATNHKPCNWGSVYLDKFPTAQSDLIFSTLCVTMVPTSGVSTGNQ